MNKDKENIKFWLKQKTDNNITNFEFIDQQFDKILNFMDRNKIERKYSDDFIKMNFIRFLYANSNTNLRTN